MRKLFASIAVLMLLPSAIAHDTGKAHPFHNTYTVHSVDSAVIVLNGASVPAAYTAVLGNKTVIELNIKQFERVPLVGKKSGVTLPCVKLWLAANLPVGKEVVPMLDNWRTENSKADNLGTVHGPKFWGDVLIDGKSVRAELLAAQATCTAR